MAKKTDAQKKATNKYDLEHFVVLGCKIKKSEAEEFKVECKKRNTSPNAVFKEAIDRFMGKVSSGDSNVIQ